jgi:hypothetical protein
VAKWKAEALETENVDLSEKMFKCCIDELRYKSKIFQETGVVSAYDRDVVKSDRVIPLSLKNSLRIAASALENIPETHRDWHPGSDETVLDLVHPSLFPVIYGRTKILSDSFVGLEDCIKRCGEGVTLDEPSEEEATLPQYPSSRLSLHALYSCKFQWLPCEVEFDGDQVKYVVLFLFLPGDSGFTT